MSPFDTFFRSIKYNKKLFSSDRPVTNEVSLRDEPTARLARESNILVISSERWESLSSEPPSLHHNA